jgi:hypothetical protein
VEVMFLVGEWPICIQDVLKNDFDVVDEPMFQGVEWPYEIIFCILGI